TSAHFTLSLHDALPICPGIPRATLYYDGECGLCDRFVQFVLRHDPRGHFQFATLQSESGRQVLSRVGLPENDLRTVVLVEDGNRSEEHTSELQSPDHLV